MVDVGKYTIHGSNGIEKTCLLPSESYNLKLAAIVRTYSKVVNQHTELEHTPSNLYQQAKSRDSFHNWRCRGIAERVCYIGVCCNFLGIISIWVFPKTGVFPPKSSILIGCSIIFTIHFGGFSPYFWFNTHIQVHPPAKRVPTNLGRHYLEDHPT